MALNEHAIAVLLLTVVALVLFTRDRIPLETSSLLVLVVLAVGFTIFPYTLANGEVFKPSAFFLGFGHEALVAVCGLMVVGYGMVRTGALEPVGRVLSSQWERYPKISALATLLVSAILSAFVNNTPIVVLLLPILISVAIRNKQSSSGMLMPMGFATLLGGMATTIGTSTNLLVVSVASDLGLADIGMFDFFLPAVLVGSIGILYLWLVAPKLLPKRAMAMSDTAPRVFSAHLHIHEQSYAHDKTLSELMEKTSGAMQVLEIRRGERLIRPLPDAQLRAGDRLQVTDVPVKLKEYEEVLGATLYAKGHVVDDEHPLQDDEQHLAELVIDRGSPLLHKTLQEVRFSDAYQLVILAIHRKGKQVASMTQGVNQVRLRLGDILLVQGPHHMIEDAKRQGQFLVLDATTALPATHHAWRAISLMTMTVVLAALGIVPIAISALLGALGMIVTNCIKWGDIRRALSAQVILIVVVSLALSSALMHTGATAFLAESFVLLTEGLSGKMIFSALILLMAILTNVVSNNAAAVIGTPIAIQVAQTVGLPPEAFVLGVLFGANMSYVTPMSYQTNLLVMNAGSYTFMDFVRTGLPLMLVMWVGFSIVIPLLYHF